MADETKSIDLSKSAEDAKPKELTMAEVAILLQQHASVIAEMQKENLTLKSKLAATGIGAEPPALPKIPDELVEHEGKKYKWAVAQFHRHEFGPVTAEEAATDTELIEYVLSIKGQGILIEQH